MFKRREVIFIVIILAIGIISIAISMQGWRSRITAFDLLPYIYGVRDFLKAGVLPQYGDIGSYGSFSPPGTAWLLLPGAILFKDPRLYEYLGAAFLHITTLLGIFLLARRFFGSRCAIIAMILYGLGESALFYAGSLWPIGRPDFYVWIIYFTSLWVSRNDSRFLAAGLAVWGFGMYVDMAILPILFIFPVVWIYYHPSVRVKSILLAGIFVLIVWIPFLRFEVTRGFSDLRSELFLQSIFPNDYKASWCNPNIIMSSYQDTSSSSRSDVAVADHGTLLSTILGLNRFDIDNLLTNFEADGYIPGTGFILLVITVLSLLFLSVTGYRAESNDPKPQSISRHTWLKRTVIGFILFGLFAMGFIFVYLLVFRQGSLPGSKISFALKLMAIVVYGGIAFILGRWVVAWTDKLLVEARIEIQSHEWINHTRLLEFCLVIPWLILLLIAEPDKPERFMWLWPMQAIFLAAFFTHVLPRFRIPQFVIWTFSAVVVLIVVINPFVVSKIDAWIKTSWAGNEADEIKVVDYLAEQPDFHDTDQARIGYQVYFYPFMADYNIISPIYKVGAEIDLLLLSRHGIVNDDQCAEGISADDIYRIVEKKPKAWAGSPGEYFQPPGDNFRLIYDATTFALYQR